MLPIDRQPPKSEPMRFLAKEQPAGDGLERLDLSLVIPTYNERENITPLVRRIHHLLTDAGHRFEIIVVDDDSPDKTWELVETLTSEYPGLRLIRRVHERGLATAVIRGWQEARGEVLAVIDGDLQHPPETLLSLLDALQRERVDIAVASRHVNGGGVSRWNVFRRAISWGATLAATWILPGTLATVRDPMSGFFALRRTVLEGVSLNPLGYKILLEVLSRGVYRSVAEVPYTFVERARGGSKFGFRQVVEFVAHLSRLSFATGELKRLGKYCIVGGSGVLVNMATLVLLTSTGWRYVNAGVLAVEFSIVTNFILNEFWSFADFAKRRPDMMARFERLLKFNLVCIGGAVINLVLLWLLTEFLGIYYLLSNGLGIVAATLWNYGMNANLTWQSGRAPRRVRLEKTQRYGGESVPRPASVSLGFVAIWLQLAIGAFVILEIQRGVRKPVSAWLHEAMSLLSFALNQ